MEHQEGALLTRITTAVALFAALIVAIGAPLGYFFVMQANDIGRLHADANVRSVGMTTLHVNTTGSNNVAVGDYALGYNVSATSSVAVGFQAGYGNASFYSNQGGVYVGYQAG